MEPMLFDNLLFQIVYKILAKLLCLERFFALRSITLPYWATEAARTKIRIPKRKPILAIVYGIAKIPDPMTVLTIVITVRKKSV